MPNYYKINEGGLKVELRPRNVLRRLFKSCLPYLTGDTLDLELKIKSTSNSVEHCKCHWQLYDYGADKSKRIVEQRDVDDFQLNPNIVTTIGLSKHLILYESDYHMDITVTPKTQQRHMLSFYAMSKDVYRAKWSTSLMSGFIGGILGVVVGYLLATLGEAK